MKPYGLRDKKTKGSGDWKKDYHIHQKIEKFQVGGKYGYINYYLGAHRNKKQERK